MTSLDGYLSIAVQAKEFSHRQFFQHGRTSCSFFVPTLFRVDQAYALPVISLYWASVIHPFFTALETRVSLLVFAYSLLIVSNIAIPPYAIRLSMTRTSTVSVRLASWLSA